MGEIIDKTKCKAKLKEQSREESETETDVQQRQRRKLPWILQQSSLSSLCWSYCSAGAAVTGGVDEGRCHFSHYSDA